MIFIKRVCNFNKTLLSNEGKYEEAKTVLKLIPQTSKSSLSCLIY